MSRVEIGRVTKAHGLRGEVVVSGVRLDAAALKALGTVEVQVGRDAPPRRLAISAVRPFLHNWLVSFEGVADNLSETGVFFTSGQRLRVTVELEEPDGVQVRTGSLVRVQRMSPESIGYAIEFAGRPTASSTQSIFTTLGRISRTSRRMWRAMQYRSKFCELS